MKKLAILVAFTALLMTTIPAFAGSPISNKVTGGAHFVSDAGNTVGHEVYLSIIGMEKKGEWSGEGSYRDKDIGLKAHLNIDGGWVHAEGYICYTGNAEVSVDNSPSENKSLLVCVVDEGPGFDGLVDRIGVVIGGLSDHYSHMGNSVREYVGNMKIH